VNTLTPGPIFNYIRIFSLNICRAAKFARACKFDLESLSFPVMWQQKKREPGIKTRMPSRGYSGVSICGSKPKEKTLIF
jgi:hypothetical protein